MIVQACEKMRHGLLEEASLELAELWEVLYSQDEAQGDEEERGVLLSMLAECELRRGELDLALGITEDALRDDRENSSLLRETNLLRQEALLEWRRSSGWQALDSRHPTSFASVCLRSDGCITWARMFIPRNTVLWVDMALGVVDVDSSTGTPSGTLCGLSYNAISSAPESVLVIKSCVGDEFGLVMAPRSLQVLRSCDPNAAVMWALEKFFMVAVRDIEEHEAISVALRTMPSSSHSRRKQPWYRGDECGCARCQAAVPATPQEVFRWTLGAGDGPKRFGEWLELYLEEKVSQEAVCIALDVLCHVVEEKASEFEDMDKLMELCSCLSLTFALLQEVSWFRADAVRFYGCVLVMRMLVARLSHREQEALLSGVPEEAAEGEEAGDVAEQCNQLLAKADAMEREIAQVCRRLLELANRFLELVLPRTIASHCATLTVREPLLLIVLP